VNLDPAEQAAIIARLNRVQGQLGGIVRMLEEERECADIVTQLAASTKALSRASFSVVVLGLKECLQDPESAGQTDLKAIEKLFLSLA
jgi:DNA-binding FrmR family transcriptional regulator